MTEESRPKGELDVQSVSGLQQRKLAAEVEKLERENRLLRKPFARPSSWVPIVVAVVSVGSLWVQYATSSIRAQKAELEAAQALAEAKDECKKVETRLGEVEKAELEAAQALAAAKEERKKVVTRLGEVENKLHEYRIKLLQCVVANFDSTAKAVSDYSNGDWSKVVEFRDGNQAVEELLELLLNTGLLPPGFADDLQELKSHYQEWLAAYASRFPDGIPREHKELIFVGSFPHESEARVRQYLKALKTGRVETD